MFTLGANVTIKMQSGAIYQGMVSRFDDFTVTLCLNEDFLTQGVKSIDATLSIEKILFVD